jgi:DNA topoisomerase-1
VGEYEGKEMTVAIGRFGPYVRHDNKFVSLKKNVDDPYSITAERAIELLKRSGRKIEISISKPMRTNRIYRFLMEDGAPTSPTKKRTTKYRRAPKQRS